MTSIKSSQNNIPKLRFPEFSGEWRRKQIHNILQRVSRPVNVNRESTYREIGIRSHGKGIFHKEPVKGFSLGNKRVFWVKENVFVLNIVFAWEQAVAKTSLNEEGMIASHRFPMYSANDAANINFIHIFFLTKKGKHLLGLASPGGAGRNKTLGQNNFEELYVTFPDKDEQKKIADFLTSVDNKIQKLSKKIELLKKYKKGVMQKIFSQEIRFNDENGNAYPEWEEKKLGEMLDYEQPTKYIVKSTEYNTYDKTPVLTAGKTFILGYTNETDGIYKETPVIIFDDFTTASQFVNFPFKVKSSALKILKPKKGFNIKISFELLNRIRFKAENHKRYWIGEFQDLYTQIPLEKEQKKIANFLTKIDDKIELEKRKLEQAKLFKKSLLQQMFV